MATSPPAISIAAHLVMAGSPAFASGRTIKRRVTHEGYTHNAVWPQMHPATAPFASVLDSSYHFLAPRPLVEVLHYVQQCSCQSAQAMSDLCERQTAGFARSDFRPAQSGYRRGSGGDSTVHCL